ncbi:MAG: inositol-3-phosphate synthase [Chlorobi bacterium]|nr:inositol-3-phosphate synthase [Chlorobiota bacterium]
MNTQRSLQQGVSLNGHRGSEKLGVLIVGLNGAVSTTYIAGLLSMRKVQATPVGSLAELGALPFVGSNGSATTLPVRQALPLANLDSIEFGGWDIRDESLLDATRYADVLQEKDITPVAEELNMLRPVPGVFNKEYVRNLEGEYLKRGDTKFELMEQIREDIRRFKVTHDVDRVVVIWCASTEVYLETSEAHENITAFEEGMRNNDPSIAPSMLYAWAAILENTPFLNGAPNLTVDTPAIVDLATKHNVVIAGKDFKTGQTMLKTVLAPMLKARMLGLTGWFSSNILGNRDGEVLDDPGSFKTKETSKLSVLDYILDTEKNPELYGDIHHTVRIYYYPPRGDNKEGWDNIDLFGWMGYPMQIKVNFLCRDSILAAPVVHDLVLFADLAQRAGLGGVQEWLGFYFKSPMATGGHKPEHDLFAQRDALHAKLREIMQKLSVISTVEVETEA